MIQIFDSDQWGEIFQSLSRNRVRTFLTAFGIFWGIFMLLLLMGGGRGLEVMLGNNFAGFAANSGFIIAGETSEPYRGFATGRKWRLQQEDVSRIRNCIPEVDICTPTLNKWGSTAKAGEHSLSVSLIGARAERNLVDNPKIRYGRALNEADNIQGRKVCVVGTRIVETLFPELGHDANPCGKFIQVDNVYYCIVGVSAKAEGGINIGGNPTTTVSMPFNTMKRAYNRGNDVDILCITAYDQFRMSDVQYKVESVLKRAHYLHPDDPQAVIKVNTEAIFSMVDSLFRGISILVWMIGLGTLLAGAIGVSNIMIVTVKERTTEIGIRRAIGATPLDILTMVLSESVVLTLMAGISGIVMAVLLLQGMESGLTTPDSEAHFQISFGLAIGAALLLSLLGVVAGLAPAIRAMKIKPVDAMREE